uniref:Uncharacterized protein n=1 Tax=Ditylenchus dipsaci TaxID=166011 RepID=A0A915E354_9BILA
MGASTPRQCVLLLAFALVILACFEGIRAEGESKASQDNKELVMEEPKPIESVAGDEKQKVDKSSLHIQEQNGMDMEVLWRWRVPYGGYGGGYPYGGYGNYGGGYGGYGGGRTVIIKKIIIRPGYNSYGGGYGGYGGNYYG